MKDDIGAEPTPVLQVVGRVFSIEDSGLAILALTQMSCQVATQESPSAGDENLASHQHRLIFHGILHTLQLQQQVHHSVHVQQFRVVRVVVNGF